MEKTARGDLGFRVAEFGDRTVDLSPEYEDRERVAVQQTSPSRMFWIPLD